MQSNQYSEQIIISTLFANNESYGKQAKHYLQEVRNSNIQAIQSLVQISKKVLTYQEYAPINKLQAIRLIKDIMNQNNFYAVKEIKLNLLAYFVEVCKYQKGNPKENRGGSYFQQYGNDKDLVRLANSFFRLHLECIQAWAIYYPNDNEFTQAYALLIQESVYFPSQKGFQINIFFQDKFTYFKPEELKERQLQIPSGETIEIKKEPQIIKKLKDQLKSLQDQKDFIVSMMNIENENEIQWEMVQEVINMFQIFTNELQKYCDALFNLEETYQSQYFNILLEEQDLLNQFLADTASLKQHKLSFQEYKKKYILSGKLSAQPLQQTTPGEGAADQTDEQRVQELQKNQLEELKQVEEENKVNDNNNQQRDLEEQLKNMGNFYQSKYLDPNEQQQINQQQQQQQQYQQSNQQLQQSPLEIQTIECLQEMGKYKNFLSQISEIISQQKTDSCNELLQILDRNFLDIEKLPDKKNEIFYLQTIRLIKDIISTENQSMSQANGAEHLGVFTNIFLSSNLLIKFTIYARYNKSSPNMNRGASILGTRDSKTSNSFFVCLLECIMGWAIIYPSTKFWDIFEVLLWEGVTFADKFQYFSQEKLKFSEYHQQLNIRIEKQIEQFSLQIEMNSECNQHLLNQLRECISAFQLHIIQIKKLASWYNNSQLPHNSDIEQLAKTEEQITIYCHDFEQLEEGQFHDYPNYHKKFAQQSIQRKFEQHRDNNMPSEIIEGKSGFLDQQQQNWQLNSLPDASNILTSKMLFDEINRFQDTQPVDFINQNLITKELYQLHAQNIINSVKKNQPNLSKIIVQSSLILIKNREYDLEQFLMARYNSIQILLQLSQIQLQSVEFINEIAQFYIKELSNYLINLLEIKKQKIDKSNWIFQLDITQEEFLYEYIQSCMQLFQILEEQFPQYEVFPTESIKLSGLKFFFEKYFQCNPNPVETNTINFALQEQIKYLVEKNSELKQELNIILGKVQQYELQQDFENDLPLNQNFSQLFKLSSDIENELAQQDKQTREKLKQSQEDQELQEQQNAIKKIKNIYQNFQRKVIKFNQFKQFILKYGNFQQQQQQQEKKSTCPLAIIQEQSLLLTSREENESLLQRIQPSKEEIQEVQQEEFENNQVQLLKPQAFQKPIQNKNIRKQQENKSSSNFQNSIDQVSSSLPQKIESQSQQPTFKDLFKDSVPENIINYHLKVTQISPMQMKNQGNDLKNVSPFSNKSFASNELERANQDIQKQSVIIKENLALKSQLNAAAKQIQYLEDKNKILENSLKLQEERYKNLIKDLQNKGQDMGNMLESSPNSINKQIEEVKNNYILSSTKYDKLDKH